MEFTEFAQTLKPIIGGSYSTHVFARTLFEAILTEDGLLQIEDISENTFKAYYNGQTRVTKISQRVLPYIDPEQFSSYLDKFPEATTQRLCDAFQSEIDDIDLYNASDRIAYFFEGILTSAASQKRKSTPKSAEKEEVKPKTASERLNEKILASGQAIADVLGKAIESLVDDMDSKTETLPEKPKIVIANLNDEDKQYLQQIRKQAKPILKYCIENDPSAGDTKLSLADELTDFTHNWQFKVREISDYALRTLLNDIMQVFDEYSYYISDKFLRLIPERMVLWFKNESLEEGEQLREVLRPETIKKRYEMRDIYFRLYPLPEDDKQQKQNTTIIQQQTNVVQNGDNNINLTNNGTINFKM